MTILRFSASADTTITNAYEGNLSTRGTGSNMGEADVLEVFSIYSQESSGSAELSRILVKFPIERIKSKRTAGVIPASGSVDFYLKLYNATHAETVPRDFKLVISPVSQSWQEGTGLDMHGYTDLTHDKEGANWIQARTSASISDDGKWTSVGGDYLGGGDIVEATFTTGIEHLEVEVSDIVEDWILALAGGKYNNYGFGVRLSSSYEAYLSNSSGADAGSVPHNVEGALKSYYTKKFFARGSEFFYYRPVIEARWDDSRKDNRGSFYFSSSLAPAASNLNKLYFYNYVRGTLKDISGLTTTRPTLELFYSSGSVPEGSARGFLSSSNAAVTSLEATKDSTGVYYVSIAATSSIVTTTYSYLVDVWSTGGVQVRTGSAFKPSKFVGAETSGESKHIISIPNLYEQYRVDQTHRFRPYIRKKNWSPNIYNVAKNKPENLIIEDAAYRIVRVVDDFEVVPYGTGSVKFTSLSYDVSGNYFDLDMGLFETGYQYGIKFSIYNDYTKTYLEEPYMFKFRVVG
jgi:hypothetical protein